MTSTQAPADLELAPLGGDARPLSEWVTNFHLALVVLDPYTNESSWLLETAGRILRSFAQADCRVAFVVTAKTDAQQAILGIPRLKKREKAINDLTKGIR